MTPAPDAPAPRDAAGEITPDLVARIRAEAMHGALVAALAPLGIVPHDDGWRLGATLYESPCDATAALRARCKATSAALRARCKATSRDIAVLREALRLAQEDRMAALRARCEALEAALARILREWDSEEWDDETDVLPQTLYLAISDARDALAAARAGAGTDTTEGA